MATASRRTSIILPWFLSTTLNILESSSGIWEGAIVAWFASDHFSKTSGTDRSSGDYVDRIEATGTH
uniref:Putative secreted protein n=1 Tax=Ixodes ricinus TaxID=34613 RepID=A0A6B0TZV2_IXORI